MVVNDYGSSDEISSVGLSLLTTLLPWNLNGIVPPRTGLRRPIHSSPRSGFVVNLSKEEISVKRSLPGHSRKQIKGDSLPRTAGHDWLHFINVSQHGLLGVGHISTHSYQALHGYSHAEIIYYFTSL
jgi:hypothetical protein